MTQSDIFEYLKLGTFKNSSNPLFVCRNDKEATSIEHSGKFLKQNIFKLPDFRAEFGDDLRSFSDELFELFSSLFNYYNAPSPKILVSPIRTLLFNLPISRFFSSFELEYAQNIDLEALKNRLYHWGYHFVDIVTQKGEVSFRGDIIDIFVINQSRPYRISLFDKDIESIRHFEVETQMSHTEVDKIEVISSFLSFSKSEYEQVESCIETTEFELFTKEMKSSFLWCLGDLATNYLLDFDVIFSSDLSFELDEIFTSQKFPSYLKTPKIIPKARLYRDVEPININGLLEVAKDKKRVIIASNESMVRSSAIKELFGVDFVYMDSIVNVMSKDELILSLNKPFKQRKVKRASLILDELNVGDFVVHENYGIGLFIGIEKRSILGAMREFVVIRYQNEDTLLIPVENINLIDRYMAQGGVTPKLDRLGKSNFKKIKEVAKDKLFAIASDIVNMSAHRHLSKGIVLSVEEHIHNQFLSNAGFIHTSDQLEAIDNIIRDFKSGSMMDRLLSADVGFGKTEVAMNAMFVAYMSGYQSMIIAPTTILSTQHYKSFKARFKDYDIEIAKIDRFTTTKEKKKIREDIADGKVDMIIGTHALLGLEFKNLAFVVIDEEHKFGVKQKEKLKDLAINLHLLSMSATPIPRSLNLALSEVKSFSEILTPPDLRLGVKTFVKSFDEKIVKEAIVKELRRGGQILYIFNSIAGIEEKKRELLNLISTLRICTLHSKIPPLQMEDEMIKFEAGDYDLMLSTSIIESGIHMPKANTIIVDEADNFGMADLHQLRGRVGRGDKEGWCWLLVQDRELLSENAKKRLLALESNSSLGSGAVLAFHDLEIRGGGNIIGEAQSGHINQIGYSLYLKMLEDSIRQLQGKNSVLDMPVDIKLSVNAYLNDELIQEDRLRLELYRRLSFVQNVQEVYDIELEIADRFGKLDIITRQFIDVTIIKVLAREKGILKISNFNENILIEYSDKKETLKASSRDDDDIINCVKNFF
ncbi:MAG: DEAD/DEAH box helicase [Sulfurovum sp.]|nr:MAG: DEAD/DEAH box helicase [Sulfurovum sp.]